MLYLFVREGSMPDILIRGLDRGTLARLDALAEKNGISRNAALRAIISEATRSPVGMEREETLAVLGLLDDLGDSEVMAGAWR